ncbi:DUF4279 domain-containing protein [Agreia bicolorata]|uniref:DUF4279 domain-containing protein n=1 Tax=Agreia bicolorata TaxID=110935 RepID=A0ABR5CBK6_9MICO|nr:DUF4279 domain-containing protein [Agreia bicolorata]KJC63010.1 hypothetical protein TZ00_17840 [Agreia bicolorata]
MIQSGMATFSVQSAETSPEQITTVLGVEPTRVDLMGTKTRSGRVRQVNQWMVHVDELANSAADQTGTGALRQLLVLLRPAAGKVHQLPKDCCARIWWSAYSDSTQGGFVLLADISKAIADLGVDMFATAYLDEGNDTRSEHT